MDAQILLIAWIMSALFSGVSLWASNKSVSEPLKFLFWSMAAGYFILFLFSFGAWWAM